MKTWMIVLAAACCAGCLHTQAVEHGAAPVVDKPPEAQRAPEPKKPQKPVSSPAARPPVEEGRPELSVSPAGLMVPEGPRLIQEALIKRGYLPGEHRTGELDEPTSAAVRKFQDDEHMAKTGAPDRETVRRLGLTVEKVFRSSKAG